MSCQSYPNELYIFAKEYKKFIFPTSAKTASSVQVSSIFPIILTKALLSSLMVLPLSALPVKLQFVPGTESLSEAKETKCFKQEPAFEKYSLPTVSRLKRSFFSELSVLNTFNSDHNFCTLFTFAKFSAITVSDST